MWSNVLYHVFDSQSSVLNFFHVYIIIRVLLSLISCICTVSRNNEFQILVENKVNVFSDRVGLSLTIVSMIIEYRVSSTRWYTSSNWFSDIIFFMIVLTAGMQFEFLFRIYGRSVMSVSILEVRSWRIRYLSAKDVVKESRSKGWRYFIRFWFFNSRYVSSDFRTDQYMKYWSARARWDRRWSYMCTTRMIRSLKTWRFRRNLEEYIFNVIVLNDLMNDTGKKMMLIWKYFIESQKTFVSFKILDLYHVMKKKEASFAKWSDIKIDKL